VLDREKAVAVVHDEEFGELLAEAGADGCRSRPRACRAVDDAGSDRTLFPGHTSRQVILTSGTTGAPRGAAAQRRDGRRRRGRAVASRCGARDDGHRRAGFHAWGLGHLSLAMLLGSTVCSPQVRPREVLRDAGAAGPTALVVVPVMLDKLLAEMRARLLRHLLAAASSPQRQRALRPACRSACARCSVRAATASTARPRWRTPRSPTPTTCSPTPRRGRPPQGVHLRIVDAQGQDVAPGEVGTIYVGSGLAFGGYTDGSDKERLDGPGLDRASSALRRPGPLQVLGRDDDMVVIAGRTSTPAGRGRAHGLRRRRGRGRRGRGSDPRTA
jgi:fatty-acyl-CoA synthase